MAAKIKVWVFTFAFLFLGACGNGHKTVDATEPTTEDLKKAFEKAINTLNVVTGSSLVKFKADSLEIPSNCFEQLDYYAQQVLFYKIYYPDSEYFVIDCRLSPTYSN